MADFVRDGGVSPELERNQRRQKENYERNLPAMIRDGKDINVHFGAGVLTVKHGLRRMPKGWFVHSVKGDAAAICEVSRNDTEIVLINNFVGSDDTDAVLWIW